MTDPAGVTMIPVKDAAERFGVSPQTMRNWCKEGHVPGAQQQGRKWLVPEHAVPEGVRLPSRPTVVPDTSDLRPKTDEEIVEALSSPTTYAERAETVDVGPVTVGDVHDTGAPLPPGQTPVSPATAQPEPAEDCPVTLDEVRESLTLMREALNELGSLAGSLWGQVNDTLTLVEALVDQEDEPEDAYIPSPPDLVPGQDAPLLDDAQALEYLASGQSTTPALETLDEVADTEPPVEIDADPRLEWELLEAAISHE